jgi:hypothetical protein
MAAGSEPPPSADRRRIDHIPVLAVAVSLRRIGVFVLAESVDFLLKGLAEQTMSTMCFTTYTLYLQ